MQISGKNVMVTGGAGFIGSTLVRELLKEKANVMVFDNFLSGKEENIDEVKDQIKVVIGDIRSEDFVNVLKRFRIEVIFNLAAEPYIPHCYDRPHKFFDINARGALNVMLAAKASGVKRVLQYSTSEVYGTAKYAPMDENHPTLPLSTYAVSKLAADRLCFTLAHEQKIPITIMRQFNVFGPRETQPYVIPEIISQLNKGNVLSLGNVKAVRDFTYVTDAAKAAIKLMECDDAVGDVVNMGSNSEYSIEQLYKIIAEEMGVENIQVNVKEARLRPLDVNHLNCDNRKIKRLTGWEPEVDFRTGMKLTIKDFKKNGCKWPWEETFGKTEEIWIKKN